MSAPEAPPPAPAPGGVVFTRAGVMRGLRQAAALAIGMLPFAIVVGVISDAKGLSLLETVAMSALVFAGSAQLLALELWTDPAPIAAAILATFVTNLRMAPMGAALAGWLDRLRGVRLWGTLAVLVDHAYALSIADQRKGGRDAGLLFGIGFGLWCLWVVSVGVGHAFGAAVQLPRGHPLYFAAPATFCAILVPIWQGVRRDLLPWMVAGAVALVAWRMGLGAPWPLLAGAASGAALGTFMELRRG